MKSLVPYLIPVTAFYPISCHWFLSIPTEEISFRRYMKKPMELNQLIALSRS